MQDRSSKARFLKIVLPSQCERDCAACFVRQSSETMRMGLVSSRARLPTLMEKCRECPGWEVGETVCWGSLCPLRVCCQNCGVSASVQCRKYPCRQFLSPGTE